MNTLRGRLGYASDRVLPYVTAGYAGGTTHDDTGSTADTYHNGWTAGAGVEMAITDSWSIKGEGLYVRLEDKTYPSGGQSGAGSWSCAHRSELSLLSIKRARR